MTHGPCSSLERALALSLALVPLGTEMPARADHKHNGFYARGQLGPAFLAAPADTSDLSFSGTGFSVGVAVGGAVFENLILFADTQLVVALASGSQSDVRAERDGGSGALQHAYLLGLGGGAAYYLMPLNVFLAASLGVYFMEMKWDGEELGWFSFGDCCYETTENGLGTTVLLGKEWWIDEDMGVGVAGQALITPSLRLRDRSDYAPAGYRGLAFGLVFTATVN